MPLKVGSQAKVEAGLVVLSGTVSDMNCFLVELRVDKVDGKPDPFPRYSWFPKKAVKEIKTEIAVAV